MADNFRKRMIEMYSEMRAPDMFLAGFFQTPPRNIFAGEKVSVDVKRGREKVAIAITQVGSPRMNSSDIFTNKEFIPPSYNEAMPFNVYDLLKRMPGVDEYTASSIAWQADLATRMLNGFEELEGLINRGIELQASQVLQTGQLSLTDENGNVIYSIDYKPKATHFPTVAVTWDNAAADPLNDMRVVTVEIRKDSLRDTTDAIFGADAWEAFLRNSIVIEQLDNRRSDQGQIGMNEGGSGGVFHGTISIGQYKVNLWTYDGHFEDPASGLSVPFVDDDKVILLGNGVRLDKVFGGVPRAVPVDSRFAGFLPDRVSIPEATDFAPNVYGSPNGKNMFIELESRPLCVPIAIDGFACLTVL